MKSYRTKKKQNKYVGGNKNNKNNIIYVIPSYKRVKTLQDQTLKTLKSFKIPAKNIYIFLANDDEYKQYTSNIGGNYNFIKGVPKLYKQRNYICKYFKEGQKIVFLDDDIKLITKLGNGDLVTLPSLKRFVSNAFKELDKSGFYIWGVYPVDNYFFMKNKISHKLRYIVGAFYGIINRHSKDLELWTEEKEDVLRTLQYYTKDGGVVRFNNIGIKTKYYGDGGMNVDTDRVDESEVAVKKINKKYPTLTKIVNPTKSNKRYEIKF